MNQSIDDQIIEYHNQGYKLPKIAALIGISYSTALRRTQNLRWRGKLPPKANSAYWRRMTKLGRIGHVLDALGEDEQIWLLKNTPADQTLAEYLATMVREKIHEHKS